MSSSRKLYTDDGTPNNVLVPRLSGFVNSVVFEVFMAGRVAPAMHVFPRP